MLSVILVLLPLTFVHCFIQPTMTYAATPFIEASEILLPDDRIIYGTVEGVRGGQIQVNIGELQPVFLSVQAASDKRIRSLHRGDKLAIVVSGSNQFIDFHLAGTLEWDRIVQGQLVQPITEDQRWAVIQVELGKFEAYEVSESARQKVLNIPVGVPALYLLDKGNIIVDAVSGDEHVFLRTLGLWANNRQLSLHH